MKTRAVLSIMAVGCLVHPAPGQACSGLRTRQDFRQGRAGLAVVWVEWNSPFVDSIRIGDIIAGVDGELFTAEALQTPGRLIGGALEDQYWPARGLDVGDDVSLTIIRENEPMMVTARLVKGRVSDRGLVRTPDREARECYGADGPPRRLDAEFEQYGSNFEMFYKYIADQWGRYLWPYEWIEENRGNCLRIPMLEHDRSEYDEAGAIVEYIEAVYPGPFATLLRERYDEIGRRASGAQRPIADEALEWRRLGELRAAQVSAAADEALSTLLARHDGDREAKPFPVPDPSEETFDEWIGKVIVFDPIHEVRDIWFEAGEAIVGEHDGQMYAADRSYYAHGGSGQGYYFTPRHTPAIWAMFSALREYGRQVMPTKRENVEIQIIGQVGDEPVLVTDVSANRSEFGLSVVPLAVLVTDRHDDDIRFLVDLRSVESLEDDAKIAGLDDLIQLPRIELADDAEPREVMRAFINALKYGDFDQWSAMFADWEVVGYSPNAEPSEVYVREYLGGAQRTSQLRIAWQDSRAHLLDDNMTAGRSNELPSLVYDARVHSVSPIVTAYDGSSLPGEFPEWMPRSAGVVEQVVVILEFVGRFGDEYRTFYTPILKGSWTLQRRNGGPWRIAELRAL